MLDGEGDVLRDERLFESDTGLLHLPAGSLEVDLELACPCLVSPPPLPLSSLLFILIPLPASLAS